MHTFRSGDTVIHYNSGLDGEVIIRRDQSSINVPAEDLVAFLAARLEKALEESLESIDLIRLIVNGLK